MKTDLVGKCGMDKNSKKVELENPLTTVPQGRGVVSRTHGGGGGKESWEPTFILMQEIRSVSHLPQTPTPESVPQRVRPVSGLSINTGCLARVQQGFTAGDWVPVTQAENTSWDYPFSKSCKIKIRQYFVTMEPQRKEVNFLSKFKEGQDPQRRTSGQSASDSASLDPDTRGSWT